MKRDVLQKLTWLLLVATAAGCGSDRPEIVPVSGRVLIDGKPLTHGQVVFYPQGSRQSFGDLDSEGRFELTCKDPGDGAVVGRHVVTVTGMQTIAETKTTATVMQHAPKRYADRATSGLSQEIAGPTENIVVELTWAGGRPFTETFAIEEEAERGGRKPEPNAK